MNAPTSGVTSLPLICYGVALIGGPLLIAGALSVPRKFGWLRGAILAAGVLALIWSGLGFILMFGASTLSAGSWWQLSRQKTLVTGAAMAALLMMLTSSDLRRWRRARARQKRAAKLLQLASKTHNEDGER